MCRSAVRYTIHEVRMLNGYTWLGEITENMFQLCGGKKNRSSDIV